MKYSIDYCGSSEPEINDDAYWGDDFPTWESAMVNFCLPVPNKHFQRDYTIAHIFLARRTWDNCKCLEETPTVIADRPNPTFDSKRVEEERRREDNSWRNEQAMQAGMAFGCEGYNEAMGY